MGPELVSNINFKTVLRYIVAVSFLVSSCKPELEGPKYNAGNADFSRYVAIGSDFTSGYRNSALTLTGQLQSYPALLAGRFSLAGGSGFKQPLVNPGNGYGYNFITSKAIGSVRLKSYLNCKSDPDFMLEQLPVNQTDAGWLGNKGPYNNLGIPGAKSFNLNSQIFGKGGSIGNPFFFRIASDTGGTSGLSSTVLGDATLVDPTFFTLSIGLNDVLSNALAGGETNGNPLFEITTQTVFDGSIDTILASLTSGGANGVVANIPDILSFPFFNRIPYNGLVLDSAKAALLNTTSPPGIVFIEGANAFVVTNPGGGSVRQLKPGELVLGTVSIDSIRCFDKGTPQNPILSKNILDSAEVSKIKQAILVFNAKLRNAATVKNLGFADMNALFKTFSAGYIFNGVTYTSQYLYNSAFSLDGIHPSGRGYAILANEFIRVINARYNSNLPYADVNASAGIDFP